MGDYPSHGSHCNARTYPTQCKYCHKRVFFFSCDHGSKVFFDELGAPWKQHACIQMRIELLGKERIEQEIANRMMSSSISADYERYVKHGEEQRKRDPKWEEHHIIRLDPYNNAKTEEYGIIRELALDINMFKKLQIEDTPNWRRTLNKLLDKAMAQVTIHTGALGDEENNSFTFFWSEESLKIKL